MQRFLSVVLERSSVQLDGGHDEGRRVGAGVGVSGVKTGSREEGSWGSAARYTAYAIASRTSGGYSGNMFDDGETEKRRKRGGKKDEGDRRGK